MRLSVRDAVATLLVVAIGVPYVGFLIDGSMPFVEDPRGMSATGLIFGIAAFLVGRRTAGSRLIGKVEAALTVVTLVAGILAVAFAEAASAEVLLAVFMVTILVTWAVSMADHAGLISSGRGHGAGYAHS